MIDTDNESAVLLVASAEEMLPTLGDIARQHGWRFLPHATIGQLRAELELAPVCSMLFWIEAVNRDEAMLHLISFVRSRWPAVFCVAATAVADRHLERPARIAGAQAFVPVAATRPLGPQLHAILPGAGGASSTAASRREAAWRGPPQRSSAYGWTRGDPNEL